jgi:EAL domain-containing protein (putative c-di-GMP-specific phosphodiesterase class I)
MSTVPVLQSPVLQSACGACKEGTEQPFPFTMAFQPIVDVVAERVYAYEALCRGIHNESAWSVLSQITPETKYSFDQSCRVKAITMASELSLESTGAKLSINFMPGAVYSPAACIQLTLKTASSLKFPLDLLIFEITEAEEVRDRKHLVSIAEEYRRHGFHMALDDFGAGYSGLNLMADISPDIIKIDMDVTRHLHERPTSAAIVRMMAQLCAELNITLIAEGIETVEEYDALRDCGITLMQGYLLAKPAFETLPGFTLPRSRVTATR